jgi:hypothetical protein
MALSEMAEKLRFGPIRLAWRMHLPLFILILCNFVLMQAMLGAEDASLSFAPMSFIRVLLITLPIFAMGGAILLYFRLMFERSPVRPMLRLWHWLRRITWLEVLALRLPLAIVFLYLNQAIYVTLKINIPKLVPFAWDSAFAAMDRMLFLGTDPWILTHAAFPGALATAGIDALYISWFFVVYMSFFAIAELPMNSELRLGFLLAFGIGWALGGSVLATIFSSAGPVYLERLTGDPSFAPLMARLAEQAVSYPIRALNVQEMLWLGYIDPTVPSTGISAFPSLHNTIVAIVACAGYRWNRLLGRILSLYVLIIMIGSVHLGWHYAVDSIVGVALGVIFWRAGLWIARWWLQRSEITPYEGTASLPPG